MTNVNRHEFNDTYYNIQMFLSMNQKYPSKESMIKEGKLEKRDGKTKTIVSIIGDKEFNVKGLSNRNEQTVGPFGKGFE